MKTMKTGVRDFEGALLSRPRVSRLRPAARALRPVAACVLLEVSRRFSRWRSSRARRGRGGERDRPAPRRDVPTRKHEARLGSVRVAEPRPRLVSSAGETTSFAACLRRRAARVFARSPRKGARGRVRGYARPRRSGVSPRGLRGGGRGGSRPRALFFSETGDDQDVSRRVLLERDARDGRAHEARRATRAWRVDDDATNEPVNRSNENREDVRVSSPFESVSGPRRTRDAALAADRLDQTSLPLDGARAPPGGAASASSSSTPAFAGRTPSFSAVHVHVHERPRGRDAAGDGCALGDCAGHGTHVAALVAGRTVGVAPEAALHSVRVLGRDGRGRVSDVLAGLEWTRAFLEAKGSPQTRVPSVLVLALGLRPGTASETLESAVTTLVKEHGVFVVAAGGNDPTRSACDASPARRGASSRWARAMRRTSRTRTGRTSGRAWTRSRPAFACGARTPSFATTIPRMTTTTTPSTPR